MMTDATQRPDPSRVAVVVPVHNAEAFLAQTLDSVLAQRYGDWHAIVVDDVSTDCSPAIATGYAERHPGRFTVLELETNVGVAEARNRAVAAAQGAELIALLDHDDLLEPAYLERMVAIHDEERERGRRVGVVGCDARLLEPTGFAKDTWGEWLGWSERVDLDSLIEQNTIFPRALIRRDATLEVGGFSSACPGVDDWDLWLALTHAGWEVAVTRELLAVYRLHASAQSRNRVRMSEAWVVGYDRVLARGRLAPAQVRRIHQRRRHALAANALARFRAARQDGRRSETVRLALLAATRIAYVTAEDPNQRRRAAVQVVGATASKLTAGRWDPRSPGWTRF